MWFRSQEFSTYRAVGLRLFIMPRDWDGGSSYGTLALIWRSTAEEKKQKKGTHVDALTLQPAQGLKIIISPQGNERTWTILLLWCAFVSTAHVDDILFTGKGCMAQFEVHTLICIPTLFSLGGVTAQSCLCECACVCECVYCKGMLYSSRVLFPSTFTHPLQSIVHMHDFQNRLLLHKNAIQWIIYHWMVWFESQSVSSPCLWKACSVLLPAVYLWAALGPALLIIHETSTGRKRSQHHAGSLSQPIAGGKNIQFSRRL